MVSTDDILDTNNNETNFTEIRNVFEEAFYIKVQEGSVLKCLSFRVFQSRIVFIIDHTDQIM